MALFVGPVSTIQSLSQQIFNNTYCVPVAYSEENTVELGYRDEQKQSPCSLEVLD